MSFYPKSLTLALFLLANPCTADNLVGTTVPPYPHQWQEEGGSCIISACDYSLGVLKKANQRLFYFGKNVDHTSRIAHWQVLDQMPYPEAPTGYEVVYAACERDGQADSSIIAVVQSSDSEWLNKVRFAYRANPETEQFETLSTQGIRCENVGWGV